MFKYRRSVGKSGVSFLLLQQENHNSNKMKRITLLLAAALAALAASAQPKLNKNNIDEGLQAMTL